MTDLDRLAIGVACAGDPTLPSTYSGIPFALLRALGELHARPVALAAQVPPQLERYAVAALALAGATPADLRRPQGIVGRHRAQANVGRPMGVLRSIAAGQRVRQQEAALSGAIQYGTEYRLPHRVPTVTYEDATVRGAQHAYPWPWLHDQSARRVERMAARQYRVYRRVKALCYFSHWAAASAVDDYGMPREKVHVVGVGTTTVVPPPAARDWSEPRFLFVGKDWERKNGDRVLRAFEAVRARRPEASLDIVGGHSRLASPGVEGHGLLDVTDPADRERLERLYQRATCFVMPSTHEPAGIVYAEAAAAGVASIGTTSGGASTIIGDGGRCVDPDSDRELVEAMLEMADPARAAELGQRALSRSRVFTWQAVVERLIRALEPPGIAVEGLADFL
jgi:glycosyltransferase involved in cell wall biosynthesis